VRSAFHLERCKAYLDLAYEYEAKNVLLVIGEYIWNQEVIPPAEQWATGVKHLQTLGEYAERLGVEIAIELEPFHLSLVKDVDTMVRFLDDVNRPAVKANIDVSHLVLSKVPPEDLALLKVDIDGTISIELEYSPDPEKIVEWVEEAYRETDKRMRTVGLRG
jgi:sugar phosphate isomerase/epimerase